MNPFTFNILHSCRVSVVKNNDSGLTDCLIVIQMGASEGRHQGVCLGVGKCLAEHCASPEKVAGGGGGGHIFFSNLEIIVAKLY